MTVTPQKAIYCLSTVLSSGLGVDAALEEIENNKGNLYDADAVDACLRLFQEKGFQFEGAIL